MHAFSAELHRLVECAVHADFSDDGKDDILAGASGRKCAGQVEADSRRHFKPGFPGGHSGRHVGRTDAGGECAECTVGTGVRVGANHHVSGSYQTFLRQEGMFDSHVPYVKVVDDAVASGKAAALFCLLCGFDVFVRDEVVHDHRDSGLVKDLGKACFLKLVDGNGRCNVVSKNHIQLDADEVSGRYGLDAGVGGEDFLGHCHWHDYSSMERFTAENSALIEETMISSWIPTPHTVFPAGVSILT